MPIPEKIKIDIWDKVWENFGMAGILLLILLTFHMFFREKSIQFRKDVWHFLKIILWPLRHLYRKENTVYQDWQEIRQQRRSVAEFDRLHPELKDKYTAYGKHWSMENRKFLETFRDLGKNVPPK